MIRSLAFGMALAVAVGTLGGCTDFRRAVGLEKAPPDEFAVTVSPPLTIPPDYALRPPHSFSGATTPEPTQQARVAVFRLQGKDEAGPQPAAGGGLTPGEEAILAKAGAVNPDARIRSEIDAESERLANANNGFINSLLFWQEPGLPGTTVDAPAEARRLREDQAEGKPLTAGNTPSIERTSRSTLEGLL